jgi:hypothetical protein
MDFFFNTGSLLPIKRSRIIEEKKPIPVLSWFSYKNATGTLQHR